jgi:serine/threonine-protein kinase RsbW
MTSEMRNRCAFDSDELVLRVDMEVSCEVQAITPVTARIMAEVATMGCARGKEFEIELALQEALANAVRHGCGGNPDKRVRVQLGCDPVRGMILVVRDPGSGFDPAAIPSPTTGKLLYSQGGRGIFLINQLMDEVRFEHGGTEIWMRQS